MKKKHFKTPLPAVFFIVVFIMMVLPIGLRGAEPTRPPEANRMQPDHAPTPFSAEEIHRNCPRDRKIVFQVETFGQPLIYQTLRFGSVYEDKVVFESITTGMDGKQMGPRRMTTATWKELQGHASFPQDQTQIQKESFTVPAGTFDCWRYEVTLKKEGKTGVQRYWFAIKLPGPPVCFEETLEGRVVYKMTMLKTGM